MSSTGNREEMVRHSGWLIPGAFFVALLLLSGLMLVWYLRPGPMSPLAPTGQSAPVHISLGGISFAIPANYIEDARVGGAMQSVRLVTLFPSWHGYSQSDARRFGGNLPDSPLVRLSLREDSRGLSAGDRLDRIYGPQITTSEQSPYGLTRYGFGPDSSYANGDLFVGETPKGPILFLCERGSLEFPSPNCAAIDRPLAPGLSYSYRFKRGYLGRWQEIANGVDQLIAKFREH